MSDCKHENNQAIVSIANMSNVGKFQADVNIRCVDCETPFRFLGLPVGVDLNGACVSADGLQARLAIKPVNLRGIEYENPELLKPREKEAE